MKRGHEMPFGAMALGEGGVRFRLWAPGAARVELALEGERPRTLPLASETGGWFAREVAEAAPGSRYRFIVDGEHHVPDPASRYQPDDVHGASEVIDPYAYTWSDEAWRGRPWEETILYELHVGAFSPEGTFDGVSRRLDHLAELGVTAVELMPVADWPGWRNWGYDGAYLFAPDAALGRPERLKALVDAAHARGLMVFLDVVYNHFGPDGNYLGLYAPQFFTGRHQTPWGNAINFDGPGSDLVRSFYIHNALYWLEEYNVDGLRLDAVHAIVDDSDPDILVELAEAVRARTVPGRHVHLVLENDRNEARYLAREDDGAPRWYVAQWNDDAHHALHAAVTGEAGGYYADYAETPARCLGRALAEGFAYQGEPSAYRGGAPRGEPSAHLPPTAFVNFLQNHDQVGNRAFGERIDALARAEAVEAALAVLLLAPSPPLLFMGEEWGADQPFFFFCDFEAELAASVREGRRREFARFPEFRDDHARERIPDPNAVETFAAAVLDWTAREREPHRGRLALCRELLTIRHEKIVPRLSGMPGGAARYETFGDSGLGVNWRLGDGSALHLTANLGAEAVSPPPAAPEGEWIHALRVPTARDQESVLPPWSVLWVLRGGARHG